MAIKQLHVEGYRSVKNIELKLKQINVLVGPNGCGKSNLYRSIFLVAAAAGGQFASILASEGGMPSILWAGRRNKQEEPRFRIKVDLDELSYELVCGRFPLGERPKCFGLECFGNDPDIKEEEVKFLHNNVSLVKRARGLISARNMDGRKVEYPLAVQESESILSGLRDPQKFPELSALREEFLNWRFYHQFRTDADSPLRQPQISPMTPVLAHDGIDLAAALATIRGIGDGQALNDAIDEAFHGAQLLIHARHGEFSLSMQMPQFRRPFELLELSDGTLQYLCLLAAFLTPRPPSLMAINEPETSIHPDLLKPLAKLIVKASRHSQIWITTHSRDLAYYIQKESRVESIELEKIEGQTRVKGDKPTEADEEEEIPEEDEVELDEADDGDY